MMDRKSSYTLNNISPTTRQSKEDGSRSTIKSPDTIKQEEKKEEKPTKKTKYCSSSESSSHTQFFRLSKDHNRAVPITKKQYLNISESISSTDTFHCVHKPPGRQYTQPTLLKRNLRKHLDPIPLDPNWTEKCFVQCDWSIVKQIQFLIEETTALQQIDRLLESLRDLVQLSKNGYRVDVLDSVSVILNFLIDTTPKVPVLKESLVSLLKHLALPIRLIGTSDVLTYFESLRQFIGFMCYLLMTVEEDRLFDYVSEAVIWHLTAPSTARPANSAPKHVIITAATELIEPVVKMIAVASSHKFPTFLEMALCLACESEANCMDMMKENIIENIFYRFNPYFPHKQLPKYEINPADCGDFNVKLGASSLSLPTTMSLLFVLTMTTKNFLDKNPSFQQVLPFPDDNSVRCFIWAYRYECLARDHHHQRITLTVVADAILRCFGNKLVSFSSLLMPDIMTLSVMTEIPPRNDWTGRVNFSTLQHDVQFKKNLIYFVVHLFKVFPINKFLATSRHWVMGMMYLLDPGLSRLRARWSPAHFAEIRLASLKALVCTLPLCDRSLIKEYAIIRRILWYIEWYSESPFELPVLYWCVRLLYVAVFCKNNDLEDSSVRDLYDTHGIIILVRLCKTLLSQKTPPVEKSQSVLSICLSMMTAAASTDRYVACCVYPHIKWPSSINSLCNQMMNIILYSLQKHFIISDRWLVALLNFIWEGIIWNKKFREKFIINNGVYNLLDLITMTRAPVQCIALALICDIVRSGEAVGYMVTWRANLGASNTTPVLVKRGSTIATLLAAVFRDECEKSGIPLSDSGVLEEPAAYAGTKTSGCSETSFNQDYCKVHCLPISSSAIEMAGSRRSKAFALLHMLSEDLADKVALADEAYNLYKNIKLDVKDEVVLVICSHYLTMKLNQAWIENKDQTPALVRKDEDLLNDFLNIGAGWNREIKLQQQDVIKRNQKEELDKENSLYAFLGRIRLNIALDGLKKVRCVARSADRHRVTHDMLNDAVFAHHRRSIFAKQLNAPVLRTYKAPLDDYNITGQSVKVSSIQPKELPRLMEYLSSSSTTHGSEC